MNRIRILGLVIGLIILSGCSTSFNSLKRTASGEVEIIVASKPDVLLAAYVAISREFPSSSIIELKNYQNGFTWSHQPFLDRTTFKFILSNMRGETSNKKEIAGFGYSVSTHGTQGFVEGRYVEPLNEQFNLVLKERGITKVKIKKILSYSNGPSNTKQNKKGLSAGTGFFVSSLGHIVTSEHVVKDAEHIEIVLMNGEKLKAKVLSKDPINDVAILKVNYKSKALGLVSSRSTNKGDDVFTLGYPLISLQGQEQKATFGRINSLSGVKGDIRFMQVDVPIQPGNSGGPLINGNGRVVGVVTAMLNQIKTLRATGVLPQNVNYVIKSDYIIPLLPENINLKRTSSEGKSSKVSTIIKSVENSVVLVYAK